MLKHLRSGLFFVFLSFPPHIGLTQGNGNGVKFEKDLTWAQILIKAKAENKYIFMDCFATWCAPCKYMANNVFTQNTVGDFFNEHFISVTVQFDRTKNDSDRVKQWYDDARFFESKYSITAYPTFLFFSPDGEAVDRIVGSFESNSFVARAREVLNPKKQYYALMKTYKEHATDSLFIRDAFERALEQEDPLNAVELSRYYLHCLKDPISRDNIQLIIKVDPSSSDELFKFLLDNAAKIDEVIDMPPNTKTIEWKLSRTLAKELIDPLFKNTDTILKYNEICNHLEAQYPTLGKPLLEFVRGHFKTGVERWINTIIYTDGASIADWSAISNKLSEQCPGFNCDGIISEKKPQYYMKKLLWSKCEESAVELLNQYGDQMSAHDLNNIVWDYFLHSSNMKNLKIALHWSKRSVEMTPDDYNSLDTYANLLYKTGNHNAALVWERRAVEKCEFYNDQITLKEIKVNLVKIQKRG
jgi:thioredoxin-related protein